MAIENQSDTFGTDLPLRRLSLALRCHLRLIGCQLLYSYPGTHLLSISSFILIHPPVETAVLVVTSHSTIALTLPEWCVTFKILAH